MPRFSAIHLLAALSAAGCSTHKVWEVPVGNASVPDKPDVVVTSAVEVINTIGITMVGVVELKPDPSLSIAFERAIEPYLDRGTIRIISATYEVRTLLSDQTLVFDMLVDVDGRTYRARHSTNDKSAVGNNFLDDLPAFIEIAAKQIAEQIPDQAGL